jgi:dephospho-CoA kinase
MRVNRVMKRNGLSRKDILQRIKNQLPLEDKAAWADFVILNNSDIKHLEDSAVALLEELFPKK